jgi:Ca2+-binding EF-hand superfamily protein
MVAAAVSASPLLAQDDDLFSKLDANKDGYVSAEEVQEPQQALFERLLRNADKDGDKKLSRDEFQAGLKPEAGPRPPLAGGPGGRGGREGGPGDAREFFRRLDANSDGKLAKDELPPRMQENFDRLDANRDGSISMEELGRGMMAMGPRPPGGRPGQPGMTLDRPQREALFDRTDANSDGKLTKDEIPEERRGMRGLLERATGDGLTKEQFVRGMLAMQAGQPRPEGQARPDGAPERRPDGAPPRRPDGPPPGLFGALDTDRDGELSNAEIVGAGSALLKLDRNNDGKLSPQEIFGPGGAPPMRPGDGTRPDQQRPDQQRPDQRRPGQRGLGGVNPEELRQRLKDADANGDGKLSREEAPSLLKPRFDQVDVNSDGALDEAEMRQFLRRMTEGGRRPEAK